MAAGALAGGLLAACDRGGGEGADAIPGGEPSLAPQLATFELLTGGTRPVAFGLRTLDNVAVADADVQVYLRRLDGTLVGGPFPARYTEEAAAGGQAGGAGAEGLGLYVTDLELPSPGQVEFVVVEGDRYGVQAVQVVSPKDSRAPVPGDKAIAVATPTTDRRRGVAALCTQDPPCGMHDTSLDEALAAGRPVMLLFATPAYCQTAVCGPAVATVDAVRADGDWGDIAWIHVEIYTDKGQTLARAVQAWELPTEPWLFAIGADGRITDRLDGPMLPEMVSDLAEQLT